MVIEKLKEREDSKDKERDKVALAEIDDYITRAQTEMEKYELVRNYWFDQYFKISWERHPDDYREKDN